MRRLPQVAIGAVLVLVAAGCGGGDNSHANGSPAGPKDQVLAYLAAFSRGDGKAACALLTPVARDGVPSLSDDLRSPDCEGAIAELSRSSEHLRAPHVSVTVDGDRATARITNKRPAYQSQVLLRKGGDGWRIAFPPAILQRYKTPPGIKGD
jgi:hypothetical protein